MSDVGGANSHEGPPSENSGVAVVLAGAGARGAYEAGVLSVLLPALEAEGMRPEIFLGSSAGAINAVAFAAMSHLKAVAAGERAAELWRAITPADVFRPPVRATLAAMGRYVARGGRPSGRPAGLLDTTPLVATMGRVIDWERLHLNIADHRVKAVGVTATACSSHRSAVFVERPLGAALPPSDPGRAIDYVPAFLDNGHIVASSAMPAIFPAVLIDNPQHARGWYLDGGVRQNTPIKPALALGARRVVVIATAPVEPPSPVVSAGAGAAIDNAGSTSGTCPSAGVDTGPPSLANGVTELIHALLADRMIEDLYTLSKKNARAHKAHAVIPWIFAGPSVAGSGDLGTLVTETLAYAKGAGGLLRRRIRQVIGHDPNRAEIVSYLFFEPEFIAGAIELGRADARRCLDPAGLPVWHLTPDIMTA